jgi:hypothetical protein
VIALDRTTVTVLRRHHAAQQAERTATGDGYREQIGPAMPIPPAPPTLLAARSLPTTPA